MGDGLFAVNVFARLECVDSLIAVLMVGGCDTDYIDIRVGEQVFVVGVLLAAVAIGGLGHSRPIGVAVSDNVNSFAAVVF